MSDFVDPFRGPLTLDTMRQKVERHRRKVRELENFAQNPNSDMFKVVAQEREILQGQEQLLRMMEEEAAQRQMAKIKAESRNR